MIPEKEILFHMNYITTITFIIIAETIQYLNFNCSLSMKSFFIANYFQSYVSFIFMIQRFHNYTKRSFA